MAKDNKSHPEYPREKLNKDLQKIVDQQDDVWDELYEGQCVAQLPYSMTAANR